VKILGVVRSDSHSRNCCGWSPWSIEGILSKLAARRSLRWPYKTEEQPEEDGQDSAAARKRFVEAVR